MLGPDVVVTEADGRLQRVLERLPAFGGVLEPPQFGRVGIRAGGGSTYAESVEYSTVAHIESPDRPSRESNGIQYRR